MKAPTIDDKLKKCKLILKAPTSDLIIVLSLGNFCTIEPAAQPSFCCYRTCSNNSNSYPKHPIATFNREEISSWMQKKLGEIHFSMRNEKHSAAAVLPNIWLFPSPTVQNCCKHTSKTLPSLSFYAPYQLSTELSHLRHYYESGYYCFHI